MQPRSNRSQSRRLRTVIGAATAIAAIGLAAPTAFAADTSNSTADLAASQTGDPDGTGSIELTFDTNTGEVCSTLTTADIGAPTMAHIHRGVAGSTGEVVVTLSTTAGCSDNDPAIVAEIVDAPADFYVNVHNDEFPAGAIRGQVNALVESSVESTRFDLLPTGDVDGSGSADLTLNPDTEEVCFDLTVNSDETVTVAHIHAGGAGVNGPVVVDFDVPTNGLTGCVTDETTGQVATILADPASFYVNVHTDASPSGAIRNQIAATSPQQTSSTSLDGLGFGDPDGSGIADITFYDNGDVCFALTVDAIETPTAAHIHAGADGVQGDVVVGLPIEDGLIGCTSSTPETVAAITADPAGFYVNVHNEEFPAGAIRGQLGEIVDGMTSEFSINLVATGDPDGSGTAMLDIDANTGRVCFTLTTENIGDVTVAHIHAGGPTETGGVVVDFDAPTNGLDGCVFASVEVTADIVEMPGAFYVNVHTAEAPSGAIRAQVDGTAPTAPTTTTIAPTLPETGGDNGLMAIIAAALLAAGAGFVFVSRRNATPTA